MDGADNRIRFRTGARPVFFDPGGGAHYDGRWQPPKVTGWEDGPHVGPDGWTASARWKREEDIPDSVLFRAMEALGD